MGFMVTIRNSGQRTMHTAQVLSEYFLFNFTYLLDISLLLNFSKKGRIKNKGENDTILH